MLKGGKWMAEEKIEELRRTIIIEDKYEGLGSHLEKTNNDW